LYPAWTAGVQLSGSDPNGRLIFLLSSGTYRNGILSQSLQARSSPAEFPSFSGPCGRFFFAFLTADAGLYAAVRPASSQ
jgi:hypothetical protein